MQSSTKWLRNGQYPGNGLEISLQLLWEIGIWAGTIDVDRQWLSASVSGEKARTPKGSNPAHGHLAGKQTEGLARHGLSGTKQVRWHIHGQCRRLFTKIKGMAIARTKRHSARFMPHLSASACRHIPLAFPNSGDQGTKILSHLLRIWAECHPFDNVSHC